jgi:uncharacterized phosphosugar-binding protein
MLANQSTRAPGHSPPATLARESGDRRAALYLSTIDEIGQAPALLDCARKARQQGLRVVTLVAEEDGLSVKDRQGGGLGGKRLRALVSGLGSGQFDVIVAHTGDAVISIEIAAEAKNVGAF